MLLVHHTILMSRSEWYKKSSVTTFCQFLSNPGVSGVRSMGSLLSNWLTERPCADLTDVTLADEDTNPILTDNANRTFHGNEAMQVTQPGCQIWNQVMQVTWPDDQILNQSQLCQLVTKYTTNTTGAIWLPNLQLMQVVPSGDQICY